MSLIEAQEWGWRHAGRDDWAIQGLNLRIGLGERVLLLGPSGAGKSTLLWALAGVLGGADEGEETGRLLVDGHDPRAGSPTATAQGDQVRIGPVGLVQQDPVSQIILEQVGDDVAFGCENLGVPRDEIWPTVRRALAEVRLDVPLDRSTAALSGGQQQRLALAGALAMQFSLGEGGRLLLLDEPTANLDQAGVADVRDCVAQLCDSRTTFIVVEHHVETWLDLITRVIVLDAHGSVLSDGDPATVFATQRDQLEQAGIWLPSSARTASPAARTTPRTPAALPLTTPAAARPRSAEDSLTVPKLGSASLAPLSPNLDIPSLGTPILETVDLTVGYDSARPVRSHLNLSIPAGRSTVFVGPNGSGKSTIAMTLAGLLPALSGQVCASQTLIPTTLTRRQRRLPTRRQGWDSAPAQLGNPIEWTSRQLLTRIGTVFQNPESQFVCASVRQELEVGLRALDWSPTAITTRVDELLESLHLDRLARANPFTLSGGEKRRLSVGTVLATSPRVLVLDEPTFGQDRATWLDLVELIESLLAQGCTVICVTHDSDFIKRLGDQVITVGEAS